MAICEGARCALKNDDNETMRSLCRIRKISKAALLCCKSFFVAFVAFWMLIFCVSLYSVFSSDSSFAVDVEWFDLLSLICVGALISLILKILSDVFGDTARGQSPFTMVQVKRVRIVAIALFADAVVGIFASPGFISSLHIAGFDVDYTVSGQVVIPVDLGEILAALCLIALSFVFKYGVLLQEFSDETL